MMSAPVIASQRGHRHGKLPGPVAETGEILADFVKPLLNRSKSLHCRAHKNQPQCVQQCLEARNHILAAQLNPGAVVTDVMLADLTASLSQAYNTVSDTCSAGVYTWVNSKTSKFYVGSYGKSEDATGSLAKRTLSHVYAANRFVSRGRLADWQIIKIDVRLYVSLVSEGVSDWFVFPLEVLPNHTSWAAIRECEQKWINSFLARTFGFNAINAAAASCDPERFAAGRVYAYRNMARRTFSCWQAHRQGRLRDDNVQQFFAQYTDKNIINIFALCKVHPHRLTMQAEILSLW
jgi:hypothetical protein